MTKAYIKITTTLKFKNENRKWKMIQNINKTTLK